MWFPGILSIRPEQKSCVVVNTNLLPEKYGVTDLSQIFRHNQTKTPIS